MRRARGEREASERRTRGQREANGGKDAAGPGEDVGRIGGNRESTDGRIRAHVDGQRAKGEPWFRDGGRDGTWFVHFPERSARFLRARS